MTDPIPNLTVATHDRQITLDVMCKIDRDTDDLHDNDQSFRYGFDYYIDFMTDSLEEIREKSHLCQMSTGDFDD